MLKFTRNLKMSTKLPASIIALSTATAGITGYLAYNHSASSLLDKAKENLDTILTTQKSALLEWLSSIESDMITMSVNPTVQDALIEFAGAWDALGENQTPYLQNAYIFNNPNPVGQKEELNYASDGSSL